MTTHRIRSSALPRGLFLAAAIAILWLPALSRAAVPNPVVEGPVEGGLRGRPWQSSLIDVAPFGFIEQEFFVSGVARSVEPTSPAGLAPFKTRIIVRRPVDPARFSGTVIVEWLNVTGQADLEVLWGPDAIRHYVDEGFAFVGISAQLAGVCCGPGSLKGWDPLRYGTLVHPGDDFSFDIFSQAVQALRSPNANATTVLSPRPVDPMGGLTVERVLAHGASQSASRLTGYFDRYQKNAGVIDGFLITRGGGPFTDAKLADNGVPVFQVNEENQTYDRADSALYRMWQEAGAAHAPAVWWNYVWAAQSRDLAGTQLPDAVNVACSVNRATSGWTFDAATLALDDWVKNGTLPPTAPRVQRNANGIIRDADGLALGGVRHPFVAAPISRNDSTGCPLWGNYAPWTIDQIKTRYPSKADYMTAVDAALAADLAAGHILPDDAAIERTWRDAFDVWGDQGTCYDTANQAGNETGPLSAPLYDLSFDVLMPQVGFGFGQDVHDTSCNSITRAGL